VFVGIDVGGTAPVEIGLVQSKALQVAGSSARRDVAAHDPVHGDERRRPAPLLTRPSRSAREPPRSRRRATRARNVKVQIEC
jgi:hypothetical protein